MRGTPAAEEVGGGKEDGQVRGEQGKAVYAAQERERDEPQRSHGRCGYTAAAVAAARQSTGSDNHRPAGRC